MAPTNPKGDEKKKAKAVDPMQQMLQMQMMSQMFGGGGDENPMQQMMKMQLMQQMMGGSGGGGFNPMLMSMMSGGANPFASMFGGGKKTGSDSGNAY